MIPDFKIPDAYKVGNVPPLASKMESFSDETLVMIFYQYPRDHLQELAAQALYKRDWRWHKQMHMWMMKDSQFANPPRKLTEKTEFGWYIFFDINNWRRERREITLNYDDLDTRFSTMGGGGAVGAGVNGQAAAGPVGFGGVMGGGGIGGAFGGGLN